MALRYFNAAGAHPGGSIGRPRDRTTLIPLATAPPRAAPAEGVGEDYPTPDGTVSDYIHLDLADAHTRALGASPAAASDA